MRFRNVVVPAFLALAFSGCHTDQAESTLMMVGQLACRGDVTEFSELLLGEAYAQYANEEGAEKICDAITQLQGRKIKMKDQLSSQIKDQWGRAKERTYAISVSDEADLLLKATAWCRVTWVPQDDGAVDLEECKISSLQPQ